MATVRELLRRGAEALRTASEIERPGHEAAILLAAAAGLSKEQLYSRFTDPIPRHIESRFDELIRHRAQGTPVAYLLGEKEFYGRSFLTDPRALIPRPETEILVDRALEIARSRVGAPSGGSDTLTVGPDQDPAAPFRIHDCCTGSGCIALTLAAELCEEGVGPVEVSASDLSPAALELARENGSRLAPGRVTFYESDLLSALPGGPFDMITANPPYLSSDETATALRRGWGEPALALDGGPEGFDLLPRLVDEALASLRQNGYILIEAADSQASGIRSLMRKAGFVEIDTAEDLAGRERVTIGKYDPDHR